MKPGRLSPSKWEDLILKALNEAGEPLTVCELAQILARPAGREQFAISLLHLTYRCRALCLYQPPTLNQIILSKKHEALFGLPDWSIQQRQSPVPEKQGSIYPKRVVAKEATPTKGVSKIEEEATIRIPISGPEPYLIDKFNRWYWLHPKTADTYRWCIKLFNQNSDEPLHTLLKEVSLTSVLEAVTPQRFPGMNAAYLTVIKHVLTRYCRFLIGIGEIDASMNQELRVNEKELSRKQQERIYQFQNWLPFPQHSQESYASSIRVFEKVIGVPAETMLKEYDLPAVLALVNTAYIPGYSDFTYRSIKTALKRYYEYLESLIAT
jgi:hypothetical protein